MGKFLFTALLFLGSSAASAEGIELPKSPPIANYFNFSDKGDNNNLPFSAVIPSSPVIPGIPPEQNKKDLFKESDADLVGNCYYRVHDDVAEYTKKDEVANIIDGFKIDKGEDGYITYYVTSSVSPELLEGINLAIEKYESAADLKFTVVKNICQADIVFAEKEKLQMRDQHVAGYATTIKGIHFIYIEKNETYKPGSNYFSVVLHEMGHALGLKHPALYDKITDKPPYFDEKEDKAYNTVMSYQPRRAIICNDLGPLDKEAMTFLYGRNKNIFNYFQ